MNILKKFEILSKGKKYFSAKTGGYDCKIIINDLCTDLQTGEQLLYVIDKSVKNKFGTTLIYEVIEKENIDVVYFKHEFYNYNLVNRARKLGGTWDDATKTWIFSDMVKDEVDKLDAIFNSKMIIVEITFNKTHSVIRDGIFLYGMKIASAIGRESWVKMYDAACISGKFCSGGSLKNWETIATKGTVIRMKLPKGVFETYPLNSEDYTVKLIKK